MTITVRWATSSDQAYPFVAAHVRVAVMTARSAERRIAVAELDGSPVGAVHLDYLWGTRPYIALIPSIPPRNARVLVALSSPLSRVLLPTPAINSCSAHRRREDESRRVIPGFTLDRQGARVRVANGEGTDENGEAAASHARRVRS